MDVAPVDRNRAGALRLFAFARGKKIKGLHRDREEIDDVQERRDDEDADNGELTRIRDIARVELGASEYSLRSLSDGKGSVAIPIFEAPGANSIQMSDDVRATMTRLEKNFPPGLTWSVDYDPTVFVRASRSSWSKMSNATSKRASRRARPRIARWARCRARSSRSASC